MSIRVSSSRLIGRAAELAALEAAVYGEMDRVNQALTERVKELAERYEIPMPRLADRVTDLEDKVKHHLDRMGFTWK